MNANTETDDDETSPQNLWRALRDYIRAACALFGAPAALAMRRVVPRDEYKGFLPWLGACENLLRKLLFLDAVKLELGPHGPPASRRPAPAHAGEGARLGEAEASLRRSLAGGPYIAKPAAFDPGKPESWKVTFKLGAHGAPAPAPPASRRPGSGGPKPSTVASKPIALRLEALIRGFNNPEPLVKRLARLLHRNRDRVRAFTAAPKPRPQPRHGDFALQHAARHAQIAARAFSDTS